MSEDLKFFSPRGEHDPFYISLAGVTYPDPNYHNVRPYSEIAVIEYITDGDGYVYWEGKPRQVSRDMIYFLPHGRTHDYYADPQTPFTKIFLNVTGEFCERLTAAYGLTGKYFFDGNGLKGLFQQIPVLLHSQRSEQEIQAALQGLFVEILSRLSYAQEDAAHSDEAVRLKEYLDSNFGRIVSAQELAKVIYRSPDYCLKLFRREYCVTPYAYQLERKMQIARSLLTDTSMSVGEIAESVGYHDLHYFSNLFLKKCGKRPRDYRKSKK